MEILIMDEDQAGLTVPRQQLKANNHELDLNLIAEFGPPPQYPPGEDLSKRYFLTDEKIRVISKISWELFGSFDESFLRKK